MLPKVQEYYREAFIINCPAPEKVKKTIEITSKPKLKATKIVTLQEPTLVVVTNPSLFSPINIDKNEKTPQLNEPQIANSIDPSASDEPAEEIKHYDKLNFKGYITTLFEKNDKVKEVFYQKKIDYLLSEINKDAYNFDVFFSGHILTGYYLASQNTAGGDAINNDYTTETGVEINANKHLYDGQKHLINNTYDILTKRLATLTELSARDRLFIIGTTIYSNMYASQEKLQIVKETFEKQEKMVNIITQGYKIGKNAKLDYIDSKSDLLSLKRVLLDLKYLHINNNYTLRYSIKSKNPRDYKLLKEVLYFRLNSLKEIEKEAIANSSDIAQEANLLQIRKTDLLAQKRRYYPSVDFNSYLGYGTSKSDSLNLRSTQGLSPDFYWELGLTLQVPIYNRGDILLNKEKEMYNVLKQKKVLSLKLQETLVNVEKSYHTIKKIEKQKEILEEQIALLQEKITVAQESYFIGLTDYRYYSEAITKYLEIKSQLIDLELNYVKEVSILTVLIGKRSSYEQN